MKISAIHIFNVFGVLLFILAGSYYWGAFDTIHGPFPGFKGQWLCDLKIGKMEIDSDLKVWLKSNPDTPAGVLHQIDSTSADFEVTSPESILNQEHLKFYGFGNELAIGKEPNGTYRYKCLHRKLFESF